ncbi:TetR/AcrR family transcriptional regulator [Streptomyces minutiscleroticus]|uniref:TetR family transcriptional regulator n=1 Tax=Streptomyces minutiscleroticus TaxID=68238 RepID=A0A918KAS3_9ACTN|nr:TetR family transcriptional regulator [Streptomyces minutiscleroticus]GGX55324.1 TetR family transcriptional regulator [Streptomyces minutiscleroticus]
MKAKEPTVPAAGAGEDRRRRKARQTRDAMASAALDLVLEHGLAAVTVAAVAERADVTRRTFSRHFAGKEDAVLDFVRGDGARINAALRDRPRDEPPLVAYRRAVGQWLADPEHPALHLRPRMRELLALVDSEPALFAAYQRIRIDAQEESVRIVAGRLGTDPVRDVRPAVVVETAAGVLVAAQRLWARGLRDHDPADPAAADLPALVEQAYDALTGEAAAAARTTTGGDAAGRTA